RCTPSAKPSLLPIPIRPAAARREILKAFHPGLRFGERPGVGNPLLILRVPNRAETKTVLDEEPYFPPLFQVRARGRFEVRMQTNRGPLAARTGKLSHRRAPWPRKRSPAFQADTGKCRRRSWHGSDFINCA